MSNKRKRDEVLVDDRLYTDNELAAKRSAITIDGIKAVRETHVVNKLSSNGSGLQQMKKSREVSINIPNLECGMQILNGKGTITKTTSKTTHITLSKIELHQVLSDFPNVIKKGAYGGTYRTCGNIGRYIYTFSDSIVEEAAVKVTKNTFSIEFKAACPPHDSNDIPYDNDEILRDLTSDEYWNQVEIKQGVIQTWRHSSSTDIVGHMGRWI